ncbi:FlgN family protein [Anaerovibrio sp. JC8]|uniref:flagellar protein FlgN n=1 Tax=Anaerovibrio sp. JC8 TaxID=1240085 RepID=UPI000A0B69FF|nr:flagellar protein FlgN [Anaerovibrio sp. JC8]ORU00597.1 FlgN family protein [Anaerovibrio sp. JC8]
MWQDLTEIIATLITEYQKLKKLGEEKRAVLAAVDLKALEKIVHQEETIIEQINKAETKRQDVINQLAKQYVTIKPDMAMQDVWGQCTDGQMRNLLERSHKTLEDVVKKVQALQENNEIMISAALSVINFKLNQLGGTTAEPSYGQSGQEKYTHEKNLDLEV